MHLDGPPFFPSVARLFSFFLEGPICTAPSSYSSPSSRLLPPFFPALFHKRPGEALRRSDLPFSWGAIESFFAVPSPFALFLSVSSLLQTFFEAFEYLYPARSFFSPIFLSFILSPPNFSDRLPLGVLSFKRVFWSPSFLLVRNSIHVF